MVQVTSSQKTFADRIREAAADAVAKDGWVEIRTVNGKTYGTEGPIDVSDDSVSFVDNDGASRSLPFAALTEVRVKEG